MYIFLFHCLSDDSIQFNSMVQFDDAIQIVSAIQFIEHVDADQWWGTHGETNRSDPLRRHVFEHVVDEPMLSNMLSTTLRIQYICIYIYIYTYTYIHIYSK